jgi:antibiotic biosynthesis monooxygenase (ABM) superfamily enzyme
MATDSYTSGWRDYSRRWKLTLLSWLGFFPVMLAVGLVSERIGGDSLFLGAGVCGFAIMSAAGVYLSLFGCPRCGRAFHFALLPRSWPAVLGRACASCGLRVYESGKG